MSALPCLFALRPITVNYCEYPLKDLSSFQNFHSIISSLINIQLGCGQCVFTSLFLEDQSAPVYLFART